MNRLMEYIDRIPWLEKLVSGDREKLIKIIAAAAIVVIGAGIFLVRDISDSEAVPEKSPAKNESKAATLFVDIGGEVMEPKVVELEEGSRVEDAIKAAGGLTDKADLTEINRAAFVSDGEKIFVPAIIEDTENSGDYSADSSGTGGYSASTGSGGLVNINTADLSQLQELTGVGPVTAEKIIAYRKENGRFVTKEDIKNVSGIGDKTYEKFKDQIRI